MNICTDGEPAMTCNINGIKIFALAKKNPVMIFTHCIIYRTSLRSKDLGKFFDNKLAIL